VLWSGSVSFFPSAAVFVSDSPFQYKFLSALFFFFFVSGFWNDEARVLLLSVFPFVPLCFFLFLCFVFVGLVSVFLFLMFVLCNLSLIQSFPPLCFFLSGAADARALAGSAALCFFFILPVPPVFFSRFSFCPDLPPLFSYPPPSSSSLFSLL
jgi:hypothetical protein